MTYSSPSIDEHLSSFPVGSRVTYTCLEGTIKVPGRSDTVVCLPGARWSQLLEPCGREYLLWLKHSSLPWPSLLL